MFTYLSRYLNIKISRLLHRSPATLPILLLWVTDRCNLNCRMCGDQWRSQVQCSRLDLGEITEVVRAAGRLKTMVISVTGGEPLLHPDIMRILGAITDQGIASNICTNGTLITQELVKELAATSLRSVSISLDGSNAAEHDLIRGRAGAFDAAIEGIRLLRENLPEVAVNLNCTLTRENFRKLPGILALAGRLGCRKINLAPVHTNLQHRNRPKENFSDLLFDHEELSLLAQELIKSRVLAKELGLRLSSSTFLDNIPRFYTEPQRWHQCYAGYASCAVSPWGDVSPCADLDSTLNIRDRPLDEIWRSAEFQELRNRVDKCPGPCWDTTNAEIAIRFSWPGLLGELQSMRQDLRAYKPKR